MSALSGLGNKGERPKGKFTSININTIFKGTPAAPQKNTSSQRQHGLQSLGKVASARRMPPPVHLPSLKSENFGNDPTINLVPTGGSGWGSQGPESGKEEKGAPTTSQPVQTPPPPPSSTPQASSGSGALSGDNGARPPSSQPQPVIPQSQGQPIVQKTPQTPPQAQAPQPGGNNNNQGSKSWSSVTGGIKKQGGFLDQRSPFFQEEFPRLAPGGEEKSTPPKEKEENKESQYGPGPSLRPQNVGNWREGGGRPANQLQQPQQQPQSDQAQNGTQTSGGAGGSGAESADSAHSPPSQPNQPPQGPPRPGPGGAPPHPMGPGGHMMPPYMGRMPPPYMYRAGFPPHFPPNYHPSMGPPPRPGFYPEQRFRGPMPPHGRPMEAGEKREGILKDRDLKEFDEIINKDDGGWAGAQGEIDYSEKIVFSDEEDADKPSRKYDREHARDGMVRSEERREERGERDHAESDREAVRDGRDVDHERPPFDSRQRQPPREAWGPPPPPQGQYGPRPPIDQRQWQSRMPFDHRGPPMGYPPFRMPPPGPRGPPGPPVSVGPGGPEPVPMQQQRAPFPAGVREHDDKGRPRTSSGSTDQDDDELWRQRRRQQNEEMSAAVERARQRREEEERRMEEERRIAAQEKLRQLDEKLGKKDASPREKEREVDSGSESDRRSRTASESSEKEKIRERERDREEKFKAPPAGFGKNFQKLPPRLQKQAQEQMLRQQQPNQGPPTSQSQGERSPQAAQPGSPGLTPGQGAAVPPTSQAHRGPPPPHWFGGDPRAWGGMPPPQWDPRLAGRMPPMDMPPAMPMHPHLRRARNESGSEGHSLDGERRTPDMPFDPRDPRGWPDRTPYGPPPGWEEHMRRGGPPPMPYYNYPPDFDRREFEGYDKRDFDGRPHYEDEIEYTESKRDCEASPRDAEVPTRDSPRERDNKSREQEIMEEPVVQEDPFEDPSEGPRDWGRSDRVDKEQESRREDRRGPRNDRRGEKDRDISREQDNSHHREKRDRSERQLEKDRNHEKEDVREQRGPRERRERNVREHREPEWNDQGPYNNYRGFQDQTKRRGEWHAPIPIPAQQAQQNIPSRSNYTSLKRTHSNVSSSSAVSSERKTDSPKDSPTPKPMEDKTPIRESLKDNRSSARDDPANARSAEKLSEEKEPPRENKWFKSDQGEPEKGKKDEIKEEPREDKKEKFRKEPKVNEVPVGVEKPPSKKMKDEDKINKGRRGGENENYRDRSASSRGRGEKGGREFVRGGRGGSRGRPGYPVPVVRGGRGARGGRGGRGYERTRYDSTGRSKSREFPGAKSKDHDDYSDEEYELINPEDEKEQPQEESSGAIGTKPEVKDQTKAKEGYQRDNRRKNSKESRPKDNVWNKPPTPDNVWNKPPDNVWGKMAKEREENKDTLPKQDENQLEDLSKSREERPPHEGNQGRKERREDPRSKNGPPGRGNNAGFSPREDSGKGRGRNRGGSSGRGRGRSERGRGHDRGGHEGERHSSAPAARGGFGKPPSRMYPPQNRGDNETSNEDKENKPKGASGGERSRGDRFNHNASNDMMWVPQHHERNDYGRFDRNAPPPRFMRGGANARGRGGFPERGRGGFPERGRGRGGRGHGGGASGGRPPKKPQLTKQNSSDMANEEWETASESSDVLDRKESKNEVNKDKEKDKKDVKKSFSSQRPGGDRQNRRANSTENRNSMERGKGKEKPPNSAKANGTTGTGRGPPNNKSNKNLGSNKREPGNVNAAVYRVDQVVPQNPEAIQNAINSLNNRSKVTKKTSDLTDVSKPLKSDKEKKIDALANIDINNYASVVVIDDQPEVSIDDPAFLFESNEGFQEVTSRKAQKIKLKAAAQEEVVLKKPEAQSAGKKEKKESGKSKGRGASSAEQKRLNKLPPRLAKQREQKEKEKHQARVQQNNNNILPKIENWDNEMANNIPAGPDLMSQEKQAPVASEPHLEAAQPHQAPRSTSSMNVPFSVSSMPIPAPVPTVNAWDTPISISSSAPTITIPHQDVKYSDKGDQHDSGIDISEPINSGTSSTRSSPSAENKNRTDNILSEMSETIDQKARGDGEEVNYREAALPQRQAKSRGFEKSPKHAKEESTPSVKMQESTKMTKNGVDAIQLPASFKEPVFKFKQGEESSGLKLDFTFDAELAKMAEEKDRDPSAPKPIPLPSQSTRQSVMDSPTSPATDVLGLKIASVKNVWENIPAMFETMQSSSTSGMTNVNEVNDSIAATAVQASYSGFGSVDTQHDMSIQDPSIVDNMVLGSSASDMVSESDLARVLAISQNQLIYADAEVIGTCAQSMMNNVLIEQRNVCKVKPQQLQQAPGSSPLAIGGLQGMTGIPSPQSQMILAPAQAVSQYHPFPVGASQLIDSRYNQASFGFSLTQQPQTPTAGPLAQPAYSQPSLFLQATPATPAQTDLYQQGASAMPAYRTPFGQSQPNTIMVSSTTSSLMSATIKPPNQGNQYLSGASQKSNPLNTIQYGQLMGNTTLQPSQMYVHFDPQTNQAAAPSAPTAATQNVNNSQIIGSQLMQQRTPVQGQSSFYSQQPLQQTGFYQAQQSASTIQGPIQQVTAPTQYNMQAFGGQPQSLNLPIQTVTLTGQSQLNKSAPPFKPAAQQHPVSSPTSSQVSQDPSQFPIMWSALSNLAQMNKPASSQSSGSNYHTASQQGQSSYMSHQQHHQQQTQFGQQGSQPSDQSLQLGNQPAQHPQSGSSQHNKNAASQRGAQYQQQKINFVGQPMQPSGQFIRNPLQIMGMRAPSPGTGSNRFNGQGSSMMGQVPSQPSGPIAGVQTQLSQAGSVRQQRGPAHYQAGPPRTAANGGGSSLRDQQAKQRAELLQNMQSLLNPANTAASKTQMSPKKEKPEEINVNENENKEDKENNNNKEKDQEKPE